MSNSLLNTATSTEGNLDNVINDEKNYDYSLKFLLIGDADVGKNEIFEFLDRSNQSNNQLNSTSTLYDHQSPVSSPISSNKSDADYFRSSLINCDNCKIRLLIWSASGQGRFNTILRSYSRGAQGIILVYDITNKWSFNSIERWYDELETSLPGIPKILIGNRLHLAFKRQVSENEAKLFAEKRKLIYYEISPLCDYNVLECLIELSRTSLKKIRLFEIQPTNNHNNNHHHSTTSKVLSLQEICCEQIIKHTTSYYGIDRLPLPNKLKKSLKDYFNAHKYELTSKLMNHNHNSPIVNTTTGNSILHNCHGNNSSSKLNEIYVNSILNLYSNTNNNSNSASSSQQIANSKSIKLNYKTTKKNNNNNHHNSQRVSSLISTNNDCTNNRKTCVLM